MSQCVRIAVFALVFAAGASSSDQLAAQVLKAPSDDAPPPGRRESAGDYLKRLMNAQQGSGSLARVAALPTRQRVVVLPQYRALLRKAEVAEVLGAVARHLKAKLPRHAVKVGELADHELWPTAADVASVGASAVAALVDTNCYGDDDGLTCTLAVTFAKAGKLPAVWPKHLKASVQAPGTPAGFIEAAAALQEDNSTWFGVNAWQGKAPEIAVRYSTALGELGQAAGPEAVRQALAGATECRSAEGVLALRVLAVVDRAGKVTDVESYLNSVGSRAGATPAQLRCVQQATRRLRFEPAQADTPRRLAFDLSIGPGE